MENPQLTAEEVQKYIQEIELPLRIEGEMGSFAEEIIRYGSFVGSSIECHSSLPRAMQHGRNHIDSTEQSRKSVQNGRIILADTLVGSKGRFSRTWHAPPGGLWGCLIHANTLTPQSAMLLSIAVGIAACEAIRQSGVTDAAIRWINDVLINQAKVAGFLIESHTGPVWGEQFHLIGFGINVTNSNFPHELQDIATSLSNHTNQQVSLPDFTVCFIAKLAWNIGLLYFVEARKVDWLVEQDKFVHPVIEKWKELTDSLGKDVLFGYDVVNNPQYQAKVLGIAKDGGLQLLLDDGLKITEHSGEIRYI